MKVQLVMLNECLCGERGREKVSGMMDLYEFFQSLLPFTSTNNGPCFSCLPRVPQTKHISLVAMIIVVSNYLCILYIIKPVEPRRLHHMYTMDGQHIYSYAHCCVIC